MHTFSINVEVDRRPRLVAGLRSTTLSGSMPAVNLRIHTGCFWARRAAAQFNKRAAGDGGTALRLQIEHHCPAAPEHYR